jgi:3-deoxy-D-manno-octulosonic-acid transferase
LFRDLFAAFDGVGAQNDSEAERLRKVGCRPQAIHNIGNLKYDGGLVNEQRVLDVPALLKQLGVNGETPILLGGSTHEGEEVLLAEIALRLKKNLPNLFLVLVPRHFERSHDIARQLRNRGLKIFLRTAIGEKTKFAGGEIDCLLVDTTGELRFFYEHATVVFVGKSLTAIGGQNPIEPAALGRAIVFGPHMDNFADISRQFLEKSGAVQVHDAKMLEKVVGELLADRFQRAEMGRNALLVVAENVGAMERTVEMILPKLKGREIYIVPAASLGR